MGDLAKWANEHITNYTPDKTAKEEILLKNQFPENIKDVAKVDSFVDRGRKDHTFEASNARLHKKISDILGPLSKI